MSRKEVAAVAPKQLAASQRQKATQERTKD